MSELRKGLSNPIVLYIYSPGGSIINHNFVWRVPDDFSIEAAVTINQHLVSKLMNEMPLYHSRAMKTYFASHYGLLMSESKPYMLRSIYQELTKDASGSRTLEENSKVQLFSRSLHSLNNEVDHKEPYVPIVVNDFAPTDRKQRYK